MTGTLAQVSALFTAPALAAAGVAAVSIPVAIHLLWRMRRRPQPWGAMRFVQLAWQRHRQRLRFEQWLLLAVRCLLVLVAGLALAGPMVSGALGWWAGSLDTSGRQVHLVVDDSLSSRAAGLGGEARFERLRKLAAELAQATGGEDELMVWRASRPSEQVGASGDKQTIQRTLEAMRPGYSASDLPAALQSVRQRIAERNSAPDRTFVVLLSDFSQGAAYLNEPMPQELRELGERARVWAVEPAADRENVQVAWVRPRRRMEVIGDGSNTIGASVAVRRFGAALPAATVGVDVTLTDRAGQAVATVKRDVRLTVGQQQAVVNVSLALPERLVADDFVERQMVLRAQVDAGSLADALPADDGRWALVTVRKRLTVGVVADAGDGVAAEGLRPWQWMALALSPGGGDAGGPMAVRRIAPADVSQAVLDELDAAVVTRPDLLAEPSWAALAAFAERGGLVWVVTPNVAVPSIWAGHLKRAFGVDWQVGLEPTEAADGEVLLDVTQPVPEPLNLLAADWEALLRPVRVRQWLTVQAPTDERWMSLAGASNDAVLTGRPHGDGAVLLLTVALDDAWTNLPTRPVFVPLVHETLRGILGRGHDGEATVTVGDTPTLSERWRGAAGLTLLTGGDASETQAVALRAGEQGVQAAQPIGQPGVYGADRDGGRLLAVNVPADSGDTRAVDTQQLEGWLSGLGAWQWLDASRPGAIFQQAAEMVNLGWPLLWLLLALVVLETVLARVLSHAKIAERRTLGGRALAAVRYLRHGQPRETNQTTSGRAA